MSEKQEQKNYHLTTKNLFNHFLLVHDFLYKFTKSPATNSKMFDAQLDVSSIMNRATQFGGKFGQGSAFLSLVVYCLKSNNIPMKFVYGFLYVYWSNHFYTLGTYLGALIKMPKAYRRVGEYYKTQKSPNLLDNFEALMETEQDYEDTHEVLAKLYPDEAKSEQDKPFVSNDYFIKNKDKYLPSDTELVNGKSLKLKHFDSFLTRYIYHSFARWFHRVQQFLGVKPE